MLLVVHIFSGDTLLSVRFLLSDDWRYHCDDGGWSPRPGTPGRGLG